MCEPCFRRLEVSFKTELIGGIKVFTLYTYNEALKTMLYHLKGLGDIVLAPVFFDRYHYFLRLKYAGYILVPAPSTTEDDEVRGFNHVIEIFKPLNKKFLPLISKKEAFKQSDFHYEERQSVGEKLEIIEGEKLRNKKVLIVDDVKTTGATLKAMINLILPYQPQKLAVMTLSATKLIPWMAYFI